MSTHTPDKNLAAVCGLFCGACSLYIGTTEDPARLKPIADRRGRSEAEVICYGCRSDQRSYYCATCEKVTCAAQKGADFCGECPDYPCDNLKAFQAEMPHRAELWQSLERIKQIGWGKWQQEMADRHSCRKCSTVNSAYDLTCRNCGAHPASDFVEAHQDAIRRHLARASNGVSKP